MLDSYKSSLPRLNLISGGETMTELQERIERAMQLAEQCGLVQTRDALEKVLQSHEQGHWKHSSHDTSHNLRLN